MYQPFLVAPFNSGISKYLKPWLQTEDAMIDMQDCYTYRGSIQKRDGYTYYDTFPNSVGLFMSQDPADGTTVTFTGTLPYATVLHPIGHYSLGITHTNAGVIVTNGTDDGAGNLTGTNIAAGSTINYNTGAYTINFTVAPTANTGIKIIYGMRIGVGSGGVGPYSFPLLTTSPFGLPIKARSVFVNVFASGPAAFCPSQSPFETPASDGLTGDITNTAVVAHKITAGTVTYATGTMTGITFTDNIAAMDEVWARWEWVDA